MIPAQGAGLCPVNVPMPAPVPTGGGYRVLYHLGIRVIVAPDGRPMRPEEIVDLLNAAGATDPHPTPPAGPED